MMIAIVILGLGMIMVATMFPVAWDRARDLSEHTIEQTAVGAAQAVLEGIVRPAGASLVPIAPEPSTPPFNELRLTTGSFAGDMFFDPLRATQSLAVEPGTTFRGIVVYSDDRVHVLHMENLRLAGGALTTVEEEPWQLERIPDFSDGMHPADSALSIYLHEDFANRTSFYAPQVRIAQRIQPALDSRPERAGPDAEAERDRWNDSFSSRRFCWAALHRLREQVGPRCETQIAPGCLIPQLGQLCPTLPPHPGGPLTPEESQCIAGHGFQAMGGSRTFDMYYVTLRRPQPTHRYARQNSESVRNPYDLEAPPPAPTAMPEDQDVLLPVAWRVQIQLPATLAYRSEMYALPNPDPARLPTGVPTEATVGTSALLVSMFPQGARFVDEINGQVYRVVKRRLNANGDQATLTLDREVVLEDIDLAAGDLRCELCRSLDEKVAAGENPTADDFERLRTVWVFPPPVDRTTNPPLFDGPSPVVGIEVRTLSVSPG